MGSVAKKRIAVVLISFIVSVYTTLYMLEGQLTDQRQVRIKRQVPTDKNTDPADVSASDSEPITASNGVSAQQSTVNMDVPLATNDVEASPSSNILEISTNTVIGTELTTLSTEVITSLSIIGQTSSSLVLWPSSTDITMTPQLSDYSSIDSTFIYQTFASMPSNLLTMLSYDIVESTSVKPDLFSLTSRFFNTYQSDVPSSDMSILDESTTVLQEDMFPSSMSILDESTTVLQEDMFPSSDLIILDESTTVLQEDMFPSSDMSILDESTTVLQEAIFPSSEISILDESTTVLQEDMVPSSDLIILDESTTVLQEAMFPSSMSILDESTTVLQEDMFPSSDLIILDESTTVLQEAMFPSSDLIILDESTTVLQEDMFPSSDLIILDESTTVLQEDMFPSSDMSILDESTKVLQEDMFPSSDLIILDESTTVLHEDMFPSSDLIILDESTTVLQEDMFSSSDMSILDESTTVLQEDMFPSSSNIVDQSTIDLDWNSFSSDSNIVSESTEVVNHDLLSSDLSFSDGFSLVLPTDVFLIDSNSVSLVSKDVSTVLPTTFTDALETTPFIWETPELSVTSSEAFESSVLESISLEPSSAYVYNSESETPNLDYSSPPWDFSESTSSQSVSMVSSWVDGSTATPVTTSDMLPSLTTTVEEDATTVITQTATPKYPIETPTTIQATTSVSDIVSASSLPDSTTVPVTTTANNNNVSLPIKSASTDDDGDISTGGKVAMGILIPVAIICLVLFGFFFYRRYRQSHQGSKNFMHPGVRYRTYSNAAYKDDETAVDTTWKSSY